MARQFSRSGLRLMFCMIHRVVSMPIEARSIIGTAAERSALREIVSQFSA